MSLYWRLDLLYRVLAAFSQQSGWSGLYYGGTRVWSVSMRMGCLLLALLLSGQAYAFRCGSHLVREGDHYLEVLEQCGRPDASEQWLEETRVSRQIHPAFRYREYTTRGVVVRHWTYNKGRKRFIRQLRFKDGILQRIDKIGYGF